MQENGHKLTNFLSYNVTRVGQIPENAMQVGHKGLTPPITNASSHPCFLLCSIVSFCLIINLISSWKKCGDSKTDFFIINLNNEYMYLT